MKRVLFGFALLTAGCCPAPLVQPGATETAFVATVLEQNASGLSVRLDDGRELVVLAETLPVLEPGQRVYVSGLLQPEGVLARSVRGLERRAAPAPG